MHNNPQFAENEQWLIWNPSLGVLVRSTLGEVEEGPNGRRAWLEEPYDMVGPFDLDELINSGRIHFADCMVMSAERWHNDQVELRRESYKLRREAQERLNERQAKFNQRRGQQSTNWSHKANEGRHRKLLNLPAEGELKAKQIKAAFRRLAQKAHPDQGGDHEQFVQITQARDALLAIV
ncbi:DnaJ domain-containing protein [Halioxenophilus sp. WMMB6]|uniref:DnaJ domain-containing protein n=1 Tax=Halioxenophilus sp. WMMB6 TaxID=3073815 RepID=UPI00295EDAFB|nr:DnaJ domain-containing protein [Halioxenophilus sp. WMMB6]